MEQTKKINPYLIGGGALVALIAAFLATRGTTEEDPKTSSATESTASAEPAAATPAPAPELPKDVRFKVPVTDLHAWIGPADALVTMVEWSDLRGAASRDADVQLKELMKEYDGKLRWVHYSVADTNRAEESERIHQFARAVYEDGKNSAKFWQVRDLLISTPDGVDLDDAKLSRIGKEVGVDYDKLAPQIREDKFGTVIALDMGLGLRFGVRQGPAVFVNGRPARAATSAQLKSAVKALINEELVHAEQTLAKGVDKSKLYDTIVEGGLWSLDDNPANRQAANAKAKSVVFPKLQLGESSAKR